MSPSGLVLLSSEKKVVPVPKYWISTTKIFGFQKLQWKFALSIERVSESPVPFF